MEPARESLREYPQLLAHSAQVPIVWIIRRNSEDYYREAAGRHYSEAAHSDQLRPHSSEEMRLFRSYEEVSFKRSRV